MSACASAPPLAIRLRALIASLVIVSAASAVGTRSASAATCESLGKLTLADTTIVLARSEPAGTFTTPKPIQLPGPALDNLPTFCRVAGEIKPTKDSKHQIRSVDARIRLERQIHGRR
jgi:hypothetical protein